MFGKISNKILSLVFIIILILPACQKNNFDAIRKLRDPKEKLTKAFEYYEKKDYEKAQILFEDLFGYVRGKEVAADVYFKYASSYYYQKNYTLASFYFKQYYNTFPNHNKAEEALYISALSHNQISPNYRLTQEETESAIESFQLFVNTYPASEKVTEANEKIDKLRAKLELKSLETAKGYYKRKQYKSAHHCFKGLLVDYPDTQNGEYINFMLIKSMFEYGQQSILSKQIERFEETLKLFTKFKKKYASGKYIEEAENINKIAVSKLKKLRNE